MLKLCLFDWKSCIYPGGYAEPCYSSTGVADIATAAALWPDRLLGRAFAAATDGGFSNSFDFLTSDSSDPWWDGSVIFYPLEFILYFLVQTHLQLFEWCFLTLSSLCCYQCLFKPFCVSGVSAIASPAWSITSAISIHLWKLNTPSCSFEFLSARLRFLKSLPHQHLSLK